MDPLVISKAMRPDILSRFHQGKLDEMNTLLETTRGFVYTIFKACLAGTLDPTNYVATHQNNYKRGYIEDLQELFRIVLVVEDLGQKEREHQLAMTLLECIKDAAVIYEKEETKSWRDVMGANALAKQLSSYFNRKQDRDNELETLRLMARLSPSISDDNYSYVIPHLVTVASQIEALGDLDTPIKIYLTIVNDLTLYGGDEDEALLKNSIETLEKLKLLVSTPR
ncbi:MAG: hypothetical protein WDO14_15970 [Bacteroidota bacterium]